MTVRQLLAYYRPFYPLWEAKLMKRLQEIFVLPPDQPLRKLSRGMRVKAILLTVLPFHPQLLVLDEPFGGLDPQVRDGFHQRHARGAYLQTRRLSCRISPPLKTELTTWRLWKPKRRRDYRF